LQQTVITDTNYTHLNLMTPVLKTLKKVRHRFKRIPITWQMSLPQCRVCYCIVGLFMWFRSNFIVFFYTLSDWGSCERTLIPDSWSGENITDSIQRSQLVRHWNCDLRPLKSDSCMNVVCDALKTHWTHIWKSFVDTFGNIPTVKSYFTAVIMAFKTK
jgi:hypothetical protein